ncbi:MAG: MBL fold metallo-hydrolase [Candidatus Thorarchaeota archaeon]
MQIAKIGKRGLLFSFKDPFLTNVYVIVSRNWVFILDTFLGSQSMDIVKQELMNEGHSDLPTIIFNSHGDYDHYWGNASFGQSLIVGHDECRDRILAESDEALLANQEQKKGEVIIKAPSLVFSERLSFPDDGLTFFHTPGHTTDSASCYDEIEKILFVGDNVETPLPYVYNTDIDQFYRTLKSYYEIDWEIMIASHAPVQFDRVILDMNCEYLDNLRNWRVDLSKLEKEELHLHFHNIRYLEESLAEQDLTPEMKKHFDEVKEVNHH